MTRELSSGGKKISFTDSGSGRVIMLIHGYLETSEIWKSFAQKLATSFRVIAVDLPGHGGSDPGGEVQTMESMADALQSFLHDIGIEKVFLVGHSLGGYVALAFAERHSGYLAGYALIHSHPFADTQAAVQNRELQIRLVAEGRKEEFRSDSVMKMYAEDNIKGFQNELSESLRISSTINERAIIAVLKGMIQRPSRQSLVEEGGLPCLWIMGAKDKFINYREVSARIKMPGNSVTVILENSGHMGFIEEEERTVNILSEFITRLK